jgi:hypothetical protein
MLCVLVFAEIDRVPYRHEAAPVGQASHVLRQTARIQGKSWHRLAYRGWWRKHHGPFGIN